MQNDPRLTNEASHSFWLPHRINFKDSNIELVKISRRQVADTTFLAGDAFNIEKLEKRCVSITNIAPMTAGIRPPAYIFHSAFCCSTLLARVLDCPGKICALKEPQVTLDIAEYIRRTGKIPPYTEVVGQLLSSPFDANERTIIKPTNMANNLLLANLPLLSGSKILLLYGSLRGFLISVLKKGEQGRFMIRRMYTILAQDPTRFKQIPTQQLATLTDLQIAAMTWLLQTELFENLLQTDQNGRFTSLHCDQFLADPAECIAAVNRHFQTGLSEVEIERRAQSDALNRNSKNQQIDYDAGERQSETQKIEKEYASTLDHICKWTDGLSLTGQVKHFLSRPLNASTY